MFSKVISWFKLEAQSIESILAGWLKAVEQLEQHAVAKQREVEQHLNNAAELSKKIETAHKAATDAIEASQKAVTIAKQLKAIVTTDVKTVEVQAAEVEATTKS